ncbi:putative amidoligase enzyme-domain-containing protein [Xylariaceae sp. FL1651]|nr:putative amidoligase enzyme-domain-containing protein [Xylariaceae sp. FL1651]
MEYIPKLDDIIEAYDDSEGNLTCGVELEFLIASVESRDPDPHPELSQRVYKPTEYLPPDYKRDILEQVLETLQQQLEEIPFRLTDDDDFHPPHDNVPIYDAWRLGLDVTVRKTEGVPIGPYTWVNCELSSVVMGPNEYAKQIQDVCRVLATLRVHLNESTSVHVHVGRGDEPFSLLTLKKFATLQWLTERVLLELHHPSRLNNKYCYRLNKCSQLATKSQAALSAEERNLDEKGVDQMDKFVPMGLTKLRHSQIRHIWGCKTIQEVALLMQGDREKIPSSRAMFERGAVGFQRFLPAGKSGGNLQTFEWRQMSGSIDAKHINQWVKTCLAFTDFCRLSNPATFKKLIEKVIQKGKSYTGFELLRDLGLETQLFKEKVERYSEDQGFFEGDKEGNLFVSPT